MPLHRSSTVPSRSGCPHGEPLEPRLLLAASDLDPTFSGDGIALLNYGTQTADVPYTCLVQPNGRILVGGYTGDGSNNRNDFALARFMPDGTLDGSFSGGKVSTDLGSTEVIRALGLQSDGKIIAGGSIGVGAATNWVLVRYHINGTVDTSFGPNGNGIVTTDFYAYGDDLYSLAIQPDDRIVAVGVATGGTSELATVRYDASGHLDNSFDGDGKAIVDFFGGVDYASDVIVQPSDGKIVVVGGSVPSGSYRRFVLLRYDSAGKLDTSFDGDGKVSTDFGISAFGRSILRQPDGKYVVGGLVGSSSTQNYALARYSENGSLDTSFGPGASGTYPAGTYVSPVAYGFTFSSYGIARQNDGKILFGGYFDDPASSDTYFGLVRLTAGGLPDSSFGTGSLVKLNIPQGIAGWGNGSDVAIQADGRIVMAGTTYVSGNSSDFVAVRFVGDPVDVVPPTVTAGQFEYEDRQAVTLQFSEDVAGSVSLSDLVIRNIDTLQVYPASFANISGGAGIATSATWVRSTTSPLPDGRYRATLAAGSVQDTAGNALAADFQLDFFVLAGDANHDRKVDVIDLGILATNWQKSGVSFGQGDFNYDGDVDVIDLGILATNWQASVAQAPMAALPARPAAAQTRRPTPSRG